MASLRTLERRLARLATDAAAARVARDLSRFAGDVAGYAREHLGRALTPKQADIFAALDRPPYRVLARSANTQGKTFAAALKCSHFYDTVHPSITLATAPTKDSVRDLLFKELRTLRPGDPEFLPKETRLERSPRHYVHGYTAANPDSFQGRHGERLGLVFDEATGIDRAFWSRGETMFESHGGHWWLAAYNPNDSSSPAYAAEESGGWALVTLSALDHPNIAAELAGLPPPIPAAVRLDTVLRRMAAECERVRPGDVQPGDFALPPGAECWWRPLTPDFESQILGRWPAVPAAALFSPFLIETCCAQPADLNPAWPIAVGCDVARFGDDKTAIALRKGPVLVHLEVWSAVSTTWTAHRIRELVRAWEPDPGRARLVPVYVDDTGGYGAGVIDQSDGHNFIGVCMSAVSPDPRFPNARSYLWCNLAQIAQAGGLVLSALPPDDRHQLKRELTTARYSLDGQNRRRLEPKSQIKDRLGRSPDRADAVALAYCL